MDVNWHSRFLQQANWTRDLRHYLFQKVGLDQAKCLLEVGCGTGAILLDLPTRKQIQVHGLDISLGRLIEARSHFPAILTCGDAQILPYSDASFDITLCHYLLLWVKDPVQALIEMKRVTRPSGHILVFAEPDYSQRIDKPDTLIRLGRWQTEALRRQGAQPDIGSKLVSLFMNAGIELIESGSLQYQETSLLTLKEWELEWSVLESDLAGLIPDKEIRRLKRSDKQAWKKGVRVLHVPTYYSWGKV